MLSRCHWTITSSYSYNRQSDSHTDATNSGSLQKRSGGADPADVRERSSPRKQQPMDGTSSFCMEKEWWNTLVCRLTENLRRTLTHFPCPTKYKINWLELVFTTSDLQSSYWQILVHPEDCLKTAFCPGPGMGLSEFRCMPFGLTGAPSTFQGLMNQWTYICYHIHWWYFDPFTW